MNLIPGKDTHLLLLLGFLVVDHGEFHLDHFWSQHDFCALLTEVSGKELDTEWGQFFLLGINRMEGRASGSLAVLALSSVSCSYFR